MTTQANIYVDQGVDFSLIINLSNDTGDFQLTDEEFFCSVKKIYSNEVSFEGEFEIVIAENKVTLSFPSDITYYVKPGKYQYDLLMKKDDRFSKILEGLLFLTQTITKV